MAANFTVIIKNSDGSEQWELPFKSFRFDIVLNQDRNATLGFDFNVVKAVADIYNKTVEYLFSGSYREVEIYDADSNKLYAGYVSRVQFNRGQDDDGSISISSKGFFSLLNRRYTDELRTYSSEDAGDIAWDLINYTQGLTYGDFGITRGVHPTTVDRDRTYRYNNIKDAIEKMSNLNLYNGFDFEIDNDKIFNIYNPMMGSYRRNIKLEEGFNIKNYQIYKSFLDEMANQVIVFGEGFAPDAPVETRDAPVTYKNAFFLLQDTLSEKDVSVVQTLQDKGDKYLINKQAPLKSITIGCDFTNPTFNNYNVGDWLKVVISNYDLDGFLRLTKKSLSDDGNVSLNFEVY